MKKMTKMLLQGVIKKKRTSDQNNDLVEKYGGDESIKKCYSVVFKHLL